MRPRLIDDAVTAELLDGETVVSDPAHDNAVIVNEMGSVVLSLCDGSRTVDDIAGFICDHLEDAELDRVIEHVRALVLELARAGVVELGEP